MDLPASYYGKVDKRNPVIVTFERDVNSFITLMRRVVSLNCQDSNGSYAKGINYLVEIRRKYKHRLPSNFYQERMLQVADFLCGIKLHQLALWQGYSLHLLQLSTVKITDITDVDHFMACFFPGGFDTDQDVFNMKVRAMQGCAICIFELEKRRSILSEKGLCKLLRVLDFIRIMMRAFQQHEHLCWQIYNGSIHIYNICRYLMTVNCSAQAMEYLLWASISLELSIPLMTAKYLPWIVTLYCAVCHCYYDNNAAVQAEEFARRALGKINELAKLEEQNEVPATRETQRAYKEASIKLGAMIFKRAVFEGRRKPKLMAKVKIKTTLKDIPNVPWPRTPTERTLMGLFDSSAAQFLGILEALWDSKSLPLQMKVPDEPELLEVILELLSAGISILSGASSTSEQKCDDDPCLCLSTLTSTSTLMDLAIEGENKVPYMSAVRFIKLLYHYKQSEAFAELSTEMIHILSDVEGQSTRKAQMELSLLDAFNSLVCSQRSHPKDDSVTDDRHKSFSMNDEFICLVDTLHKSVCGSAPEVQLDGDLVLDVVFFLWDKVKLVMQRDKLQRPDYINYLEKVDKLNQWLWCLSRLCEVAIACDLATVDCMMVTEMIHILVVLLENAAEHTPNAAGDGVNSFSLLASSSTELLQIVYEMAERGLNALAKGVATLLPQDGSAVTDTAFMQKFCSLTPSTPSTSSLTSQEGTEVGQIDKKEQEEVDKSDIEGSFDAQSRCVALLATDLHLELDIIHHRAYLKLMQLNAVSESELSDRIRKNKVSKALFLIQKALLVHSNKEPNKSRKTKSLLEEASLLIQKAEVEERRLYIAVTLKTPAESKDKGIKEEETPPPPPILLSRTDHSFIFAPAPYKLEGEVCWYQLCGRVAEDINRKVRLGDCSLPGTGNMVPAVSGDCVLRVEGLVPNQKYVFAVAAYNSQGKLLGNTIGGTTFPLLASMSVPLLSTWAHLAQVAFQTQQYALAKRTCRELWSHYTMPDLESHSTQDRLATTRLNKQTVRLSSPHLCQLFLISIFIETEINIQQENLYCNSFSNSEPFIWQQEARLAECERMLVAMDLAMCLNDGIGAVQAVVTCYGLLAPLIFHQITCNPVVQVLKKCLIVLEENSGLLKQNWTGSISESMMHMVACITYYLSKTLRALSEHHVAFAVMDCGRRLIQEVYDAQLPGRKLASEAVGSKLVDQSAVKGEVRISLQLKALHAKNKKRDTSDALTTDNEMTRPQTGCDDPTILYDLICNSTLKDAYQASMKLRHKPFFTEYAALLLQRTMEEGQPDLVLQWGQHMFEFLSRRDDLMGLSTKCLQGNPRSKKKNTTSKGNELSQNKNPPGHDDTRHKVKESKPHSVIHRARSNREMKVVENLLTMMSFVVQRRKKNLQLRNICSEERVWRSHLNYSMAQAHMALVYQSLEQLHGQTPQHRYSHLNPLCFSLAYSGMLLRRNSQQQSFKQEVATERCSSRSGLRDSVAANRNKKKVRADSVTDENCGEGEGWSQTVDSFNKAASHFQRAMVLAHRGGHWTTLQYLCQTVWDHSCRITSLVQLEPQSLVTAEDMNNTTTKLLVLATDLIMDMLNRLELWSLYDRDSTEEELESSLHFSVPLDNSTQVDLRWVRILVLHTLERLHESGKWESLAHFALLFNSYTRERYTLIATPLIVHAQRKLLERISCFGGPAVPQPHHVKTQKVTGKEVTCKSYAECQLLSGWTPNHADQLPVRKKSALKNSAPQHAVMMNDAERQQSMSLVCVPLDVEDTLRHYHQAFERRPQCFHVLQHSRSLLSLLLANTQPCFVPQLRSSESRSLSHSASLVDFSPIVLPTPNTQPSDPTEEEYPSIPNPLYNQPIGSEHMLTVTAAYSTSIKCLQTTNHESLTVQALHEMGNLHFYNGNTRAAHSCWNKAVDCALQTSGVIEKWDGVSFGSGSLQQTLKQAGFWGCLLAAEITAKIAQHILTSDVGQRTKCCLLSAHLFKSLLCCSLAQPQADLQYASHSIGDELLPGVDLFSEPHRVHLGTIITSLNFACHWLFTTGYFITLLPLLAIYLHFVGTVCRDVHRTVEGKILKIRALTELCLFTEATKEAVQLTQGVGVPLTYGHCVAKDSRQPVKTFFSSKSLLDNAQALEELVNCEFTPVVQTLYGSTLCLRLNLARVQLILGLSNTVHGLPVSDSVEVETDGSIKGSSENPDHQDQEGQDSESSTSQQKVLHLDPKKEKLTPERIKFLLLEGASFMLNAISQQLTSQCCSEIEKLEVAVESKLLQVNLYLQQGHTSLSFQTAVSSLVLLQTSPVITTGSASGSMRPKSDRPYSRTRSKRRAKDRSVSDISHGDCPEAVEAGERIGVYLWLHCRLALVRCLAAHIPAATALSPGKNINEEAAQVLQEGLDECASWGDIDIRGLLMVEAAELKALRGKIDDSVEMLQKAVNLLSGLTFRPPGSSVTLARAVLLLSDLRREQSTTLLRLTQKLLLKQLCVFGENVVLQDGKVCFCPPGPNNIYLPYLNILDQITLQTGHIQDLNTMEMSVSAQSLPVQTD